MDNEPAPKRLKLSLQPSLDQIPVDIEDNGQEIFKNEPSLSEKLMRNVDRIWGERGNWCDISEESLQQSITAGDDDTSSEANDKDANNQSVSGAPSGFDMARVRESVHNKLCHAKSEIDVSLDVINILLSQNRSKDVVLPLPPGTLHATYVAKPRPTVKAQLESAQLTLGLKRKQQRNASEFLRSSATKLRSLVDGEQQFWEEALELRRNNWLMHANTASADTSFLVRYGYTDAGSDFNEVSFGEFSRANDDHDEEKTRLTLPHSLPRRMVANVSISKMGKLDHQSDMGSEVIMGMSEEVDEKSKDDALPCLAMSSQLSKIQQQLVEAQSTIFDAELYASVLSEAQGLASNNDVRFDDEEVIVTIDGHVDLSIRRVEASAIKDQERGSDDHDNKKEDQVDTPLTTRQISGRTLDLALRLLLLQRYRLNTWKTRARLLCPNRKIQQLLTTMGEPPLQPSSASGSTSGTASGSAVGGSGTNRRMQQTRGTNAWQPSVPVLSPALAMCKFWVLFDRVRQLVYDAIEPFTGEGGTNLSVHYELRGDGFSNQRKRHDGSLCDSYPGVGEMAINLSISILKGQFLLFVLHESGNITVRLPQGLMTLSNISEFQALLTREINLIGLRMVCEVANSFIRCTPGFQNATPSEQGRCLWKVDDIEETINGSISWALGPSASQDSSHVWRSIHVQLIKTPLEGKPAYQLQFQLRGPAQSNERPTSALPSITREILFSRTQTKDAGVLTFSEKIKLIVEELVQEAASSIKSP